MTTAAHTTSPWTLTSKYNNIRTAWTIKGPDGKSVCTCTSNTKRDGDEVEANAHLVCAAPDLLKALKAMVDQECGNTPITQAEELAVLAIAKAEGRAR